MVGLVLIVAEVVRWDRLTHTWLKDQAAIHAIAADLVAGQLDSPYPMPYTTALYHAVLAGIFALFGESALLPRLLATALVVGTTVLTWRMARRLSGPHGAFLAAAFCALSPLMLSLPVVGIPNDPLLLLLSLWFVTRGLEKDRPRLIALAGGILGASLYIRFFLGPLAAALILLVPFCAPPGRRLRTFGTLALSATVVALPFLIGLLATDAGRLVRSFIAWSSSDETTFHTALGTAARTPLASRATQFGLSVIGVADGSMDAGGPAPRLVRDWGALVLAALGVPLLLARLRRADGAFLAHRVFAAWILAACFILIFVVSWPAEGEGGAAHRAPRYLVMLFPAPWILGGLAADRVLSFVPWSSLRVLLTSLLLLPALLSATLPEPLRLLREKGRSERDTVPLLDRELRRARRETGRTPWLLADFPAGDARHWRTLRFPLGRAAFLAAAGDLPADWGGDPRVVLMGRFPQVVYQVQPEIYRVELAMAGQSIPALFAMEHQPLPPLGPLRSGGEVGADLWPLVIALTADRAANRVFFRPPAPTDDGESDRIRRFQTLQPEVRSLGSLSSSVGPLMAVFRLDLPSRRWASFDVRFGTEAEAFAAADRLWAWRSTLFVPWLGYGFSHALIDGPDNGAGPALPRGLRFPLATSFQVAAPDGPVDGVVTVAVRVGERVGTLVVEGVPILPPASAPEQAGETVRELDLPFHVVVQGGRLELDLRPSQPGLTPWSLLGLRFAPSAPHPTTGGVAP